MKLISKACGKSFWQEGSLGRILWACPEVAYFWKKDNQGNQENCK